MILKKWCWVATETRKGWRVKFAADKDYLLKGTLFKSVKDVEKVLYSGKIVFVHMNSK